MYQKTLAPVYTRIGATVATLHKSTSQYFGSVYNRLIVSNSVGPLTWYTCCTFCFVRANESDTKRWDAWSMNISWATLWPPRARHHISWPWNTGFQLYTSYHFIKNRGDEPFNVRLSLQGVPGIFLETILAGFRLMGFYRKVKSFKGGGDLRPFPYRKCPSWALSSFLRGILPIQIASKSRGKAFENNGHGGREKEVFETSIGNIFA